MKTNKFLYFYCFFVVLIIVASQHSRAAEENKAEQASIRLNSDNSVLNGKTGLFEHCGNAMLTQLNITITAKCITGKRREDGSYDFIAAIGELQHPAMLIQNDLDKKEKLVVEAGIIEYKVQQKHFSVKSHANLELSNSVKDSLKISANSIEIDNRVEQSRIISALGSPLKMELKKLGNTDLEADSKQLYYNTGTSELKLSQDVIANLELGQISAGIFEYNGKTKESSFTRSSEEQIEIIQNKKKQPK